MALHEAALEKAVTAANAVQPLMVGDEHARRRREFLTNAITGYLDEVEWLHADFAAMERLAKMIHRDGWELMIPSERRNAVSVAKLHFEQVIKLVRGDEPAA